MLLTVELFVMLVLANGSPVIAARLLHGHGNRPIDGGRLWHDGRPLLGPSKTWRGLIVGTLSCLLFALVAGLDWLFGALFGLLALWGDMVSSFTKRRMGLAASARAPWLDQLPEAVLPMLLAWFWLGLPFVHAMVVAVVFSVSNMLLSPLFYRLGIRKQPH